MFYEQSVINKLLKCQHCNQPYEEYFSPRILPCCSKTICQHCVRFMSRKSLENKSHEMRSLERKSSRKAKYKCLICQEEGIMPSKGLPVNEAVALLMGVQPKEVSRGAEAEKLKQNIIDLDNLANKLNFELDNGEHLIKEHCTDLKKQVQLAKEERISQISNQGDLMIERIENYEQNCIQKYQEMKKIKKIEKKELLTQVTSVIQKQKTYLNQLIIDDNETIASNESLNEFKSRLEQERENVKNLVFNNQLMKFDVSTAKVGQELLGTLDFERVSLKKIISCSFTSIKILDVNTNECIKTFLGHKYWTRCAKLLNYNQIISCSEDKTVKLWDMASGDCLSTLLGHSEVVYYVEVLKNEIIASCSFDKTIRIWNIKTGECLKILEGHIDSVNCIKKLPHDCLISCSGDKTIKLWDFNTGDCLRTYRGHQGKIYCLEILSNGLVLSGSEDKTIKVWNVDNPICLETLKGNKSGVYCICALSNEKIATGFIDNTIKVWSLKTNRCIETLNGHANTITGIHVISNNELVSSSNDGTIKIWDLNSGNCTKTIQSDCAIRAIQAF